MFEEMNEIFYNGLLREVNSIGSMITQLLVIAIIFVFIAMIAVLVLGKDAKQVKKFCYNHKEDLVGIIFFVILLSIGKLLEIDAIWPMSIWSICMAYEYMEYSVCTRI